MFNKQKVLKHLLKIVSHFEPLSSDFLSNSQWWMNDGIIIALDDEGIHDKREIIQEIYRDPFVKENFPEDFVRDKVNALIATASQKPDNERSEFCREQIDHFSIELQKEIIDWVIFIPIDNLKIEKSWSIGDVKFYSNEHGELAKKIRNRYSRILIDNPHYSKDQKLEMINWQLTTFEESSKGFITAFAEVHARGIDDIALKESIKKVRLSLNIIRLYNFHHKDSFNQYFGITGEVTRHNWRYIMRYEKESQTIRPKIERTGFILPFELNQERIAFMNKNGLRKLKTIFKSNKRSGLETRLLSTIFWYGEAINTDSFYDENAKTELKDDFISCEFFGLNQKFLKLMISLESLLLFDQSEPPVNNVAERTAFLFSKGYNDRKKIKEKIKNFYVIRSKIVHHGESDLKISDVYVLSWIIQKIIFNLIRKIDKIPLKEKEDLRQYFEKIKLS